MPQPSRPSTQEGKQLFVIKQKPLQGAVLPSAYLTPNDIFQRL